MSRQCCPGRWPPEFRRQRTRGGGPDSRKMPGAQTAEAVAQAIAAVIEEPRADVYTQPEFRGRVAAYYGAEDMAAVEARFVSPAR